MPHEPGPSGTPAVPSHLTRTPQRRGPRRDHLDPRGARFLEPRTALRFVGQDLGSTAYQGAGLLVRPEADGRIDPVVLAALERAAEAEHWAARVVEADEDLLRVVRDARISLGPDGPLVVRVVLDRRPGDDEPRSTPDAWPVLQRFRTLVDAPRRRLVQLQHLLTTAAPTPEGEGGLHGNYYVAHAPAPDYYVAHGPHPTYYVAHGAGPAYYVAHGTDPSYYVAHPAGTPGSAATAEYAQPGWGGRVPVRWVGPRPARLDEHGLDGRRRPVVAVLDTGAGRHPWLDDRVVDRTPTCEGLPVGLHDPATDIERLGILTERLTGSLDIEAGHGTFVAGLVHQRCPDAHLLAVRVVQPDGVVDEYDVLEALQLLWVRQAVALAHDRPEDLVDVVSISLGYYHEDPADADFDPIMLTPLRALARLGVAVVVSAGNDATFRPIFPAAFAPHRGGVVPRTSPEEVPLVAVGALNPDGSAALFSNDGPWVRAWRPGASVVSTVPTGFDGSQQASARTTADGMLRSTIDPDNFSSGFATWSGTSFAAPVLAGDLAQRLLDSGATRLTRQAERVAATWRAVLEEVPDVKEAP